MNMRCRMLRGRPRMHVSDQPLLAQSGLARERNLFSWPFRDNLAKPPETSGHQSIILRRLRLGFVQKFAITACATAVNSALGPSLPADWRLTRALSSNSVSVSASTFG